MKSLQILLAVLLLGSATSQAAIYGVSSNYSGTLDTVIPDANPTGISSTITVSGLAPVIGDVNVFITVAGGANGDLYAYLSHNGVLVPLLNRVGTGEGDPIQSHFGYTTAGFSNLKLDDSAIGGSIHSTIIPGSFPSASYTPDGGSLAAFTGNPNGGWTLYIADMAAGGGSTRSTLVSWSLEIDAVPEPVNVALAFFGVIVASRIIWQRWWRKRSTVSSP